MLWGRLRDPTYRTAVAVKLAASFYAAAEARKPTECVVFDGGRLSAVEEVRKAPATVPTRTNVVFPRRVVLEF